MFKFKSFKFVLMVAAVVMISSLTVGCSKKAIQELLSSMGNTQGDFYGGDQYGPPQNMSFATLKGHVADYNTQAGVHQAVVNISGGGRTATIYTDQSGVFTLTSLPMNQSYSITVNKEGYSQGYATVPNVSSSNFDLPTIYLTKMSNETYQQYGKAYGTVKDMATNMGIPYATIIAYDSNGYQVATSYTDSVGFFSVTNAKEGNYMAEASANNYKTSPRQSVRIYPGGNTEVSFMLEKYASNVVQKGSISGRVQDQYGNGIVQAPITLSPEVTPGATRYSDYSGYFYIGELPAGTYKVMVASGSYATTNSNGQLKTCSSGDSYVTITAGQNYNGMMINLTAQTSQSLLPVIQIVSPANGATLPENKVDLQLSSSNADNVEILVNGNFIKSIGRTGKTGQWGESIDLRTYYGQVKIAAHARSYMNNTDAWTDIFVNLPANSGGSLPTASITTPTSEAKSIASQSTLFVTVANGMSYQIWIKTSDMQYPISLNMVEYFNSNQSMYSGSYSKQINLTQYIGKEITLFVSVTNNYGTIYSSEIRGLIVNP